MVVKKMLLRRANIKKGLLKNIETNSFKLKFVKKGQIKQQYEQAMITLQGMADFLANICVLIMEDC